MVKPAQLTITILSIITRRACFIAYDGIQKYNTGESIEHKKTSINRILVLI